MFVCVYQQYQSDEYITLLLREGNMMRNRALRWTKDESHCGVLYKYWNCYQHYMKNQFVV